MSASRNILRYHLRRIFYANATVRRMILRDAKGFSPANSHASGDFWDSALRGPFKTYLGSTESIDARNALMSVLIARYACPMPRVLDVGCAGGDLVNAIRTFRAYLGIDISSFAVEQAQQKTREQNTTRDGSVNFVVSDMCEMQLGGVPAWDVIVFNEVLYYQSVEDAVKQVARYRAVLSPQGIICVSMKDDGKSQAIFRGLEREYIWKQGFLWQSKMGRAEYRITVSREQPAYLLAALTPFG